MDYSDQELFELLRHQKEVQRNQGLTVIYRRFYPSIRSYVISNSGNEENAADVFQDAIIVLYEKAREPDFVLNSTIKTLLYSISKYVWLNKLRKVKKETRLSEIELEQELMEKYTITDIADHKNLLSETLHRLGPTCQKVLVLYYYSRVKMVNIAMEMGFSSEQVAKNKKSACMKSLRKLVLGSSFLSENLR